VGEARFGCGESHKQDFELLWISKVKQLIVIACHVVFGTGSISPNEGCHWNISLLSAHGRSVVYWPKSLDVNNVPSELHTHSSPVALVVRFYDKLH